MLQSKKITISQYINNAKTSKKTWKKKKKSRQNKKKNQKNSISATAVNITSISRWCYNKPKKSDLNIAKITYYCYKKNGHYINKYPKPKNW